MANIAKWAALAVAGLCALATQAQADTLKDVRARGVLNCGVNEGLLGFALKDDKGVWSGFDADFCRAVAAAVLGDPAKVAFLPFSADDRFKALSRQEDRPAVAQFELDARPRERFVGAVHRRRLL